MSFLSGENYRGPLRLTAEMVGLALVGLLTLRDTRLTDTPAAPVLSCYVTWPLKEPILAMPFYDLLLARRPKIQRFPHVPR